MLDTILEASEKFCTHQLDEKYTLHNEIPKIYAFITYMDIEARNADKYRVYIASESKFIQKIATLFLEEDQSDDATLTDMSLETANIIIGSAKVIAENKNGNSFTINTPSLDGYDIFDLEYDEAKMIKVQDSMFVVAIKELKE